METKPMRKGLLGALAALAGAALVLAGVIAAGRWAHSRLQEQQFYSLAFMGIDCAAPEGLSREDFLAEVQFLAGQPDRLPLLDAGLPGRLAEAFARHPWVEEVRRVEVLPGRRLHVDLAWRRPVLAVRLMTGDQPADGSVLLPTWAGTMRTGQVPCRAVDRRGVLLPVQATRAGLPILNTAVGLPAGPAGTPWGDARVVAAARAAAFLEAERESLGLADADWEVEGDSLVLARPQLRILWGRAPGQDNRDEASAAVKLQRLRDYAVGHQGLRGCAHDVRPPPRAVHTPLASVAGE
jgi:hypothetical protein